MLVLRATIAPLQSGAVSYASTLTDIVLYAHLIDAYNFFIALATFLLYNNRINSILYLLQSSSANEPSFFIV